MVFIRSCLAFSSVKQLGMKKLLERRTTMSVEGREIRWMMLLK
jgi:hypothetical protein